MITLIGKKIPGTGTATENLKKQIPEITKEFPEISECHFGTINLRFDNQLIVHLPDHRTQPIPWHPDFGVGEIFDLLRIEIEAPKGTQAVSAWLYIPHGSPHRNTPNVHEVLGPYLPNTDSDCKIIINRQGTIYKNGRYELIVV